MNIVIFFFVNPHLRIYIFPLIFRQSGIEGRGGEREKERERGRERGEREMCERHMVGLFPGLGWES